ncbi:MAG: hypothetical protein FWG64_01410, partial [Firmicutes bacterium]|nr:hypothetical protein [Bacillota bacterium]
MIIYSTEHFMGFSQMLTLRLTKHSNEQAVLIFVSNYDSLRVKQPFFDKLKQTGLFDKIITLIELPLKGLTESQIIQKILADYTPVLEQHDINLHNATAIYEFWDWYASFAFLLNYHNIPYIQLEPLPNNISYFYERPSQFAKKGFISKDYENLYKKIYKVDKHNKPTGNIMLFEETTFFDNANLTEQQKTFVEKFDFYKQFNLVDETDKQKIISCFDVDISFLQNNPITFLLPNSAGLTSLISQKSGDSLKDILYTEENYAQCYITLVDYFANQSNKIVYNPHPDQAKGLKGINTFTNRKIKHFDTNMPAEFLQWIPNFRIKQALSVKSSSTEKLHSIIDENISLDWGVVQAYNIMDRLFVMQKIVSNLDNHTNIKFYGIADKACETLYKCNFENYLTKNFIMLKSCKNLELLNSDVCFVNSKINAAEPISNQNFILDMLEKSQPNSIVFFTNIFNESAFVPLLLSRKFLLDFIVPIQINRTPLDDGEQVG